jgi:hypothetical protein
MLSKPGKDRANPIEARTLRCRSRNSARVEAARQTKRSAFGAAAEAPIPNAFEAAFRERLGRQACRTVIALGLSIAQPKYKAIPPMPILNSHEDHSHAFI